MKGDNNTYTPNGACEKANQGQGSGDSCNSYSNDTSLTFWTCCTNSEEPTPSGGETPAPSATCGTDDNSLDGQCASADSSQCSAGTYDSATCTGTDVCCKPADSGFTGVFDTATTTNLAGWACQPYNNYADKLTINFYANGDNKTGTLIGSVTANQVVADIAPECGTSDNPNSNNHSFSFNPADAFGNNWNPIPNTISAYAINAANETEEPLNPGIPISVQNSPSGGGNGTGTPSPTSGGSNPTSSGPTPTPNLTPEPAVANVSLQVDSIDAIDAVTERVPVNKKRHLTLYLYPDESYQTDPNGTSPKAIKATGDIYFTTGDPNVPSSYGTYVNAQFPLGTIPSGDYYVFGQTEGSLREPLTDTPQKISINNGMVNNLTFSQKLPMGRLSKDNKIGALDFSDIVSCYGNKINSADCLALGINDDIFSAMPFADFNMDGVVDGIDYNIWARNAGRSGL